MSAIRILITVLVHCSTHCSKVQSLSASCTKFWIILDQATLKKRYSGHLLRHGRDVHPTWVRSSIETLSNTMVWGFWSTRAKSEEDFDSY